MAIIFLFCTVVGRRRLYFSSNDTADDRQRCLSDSPESVIIIGYFVFVLIYLIFVSISASVSPDAIRFCQRENQYINKKKDSQSHQGAPAFCSYSCPIGGFGVTLSRKIWLKFFAKCNNFAICTCYFAKLLHKTPYFRKILCYFIAFVKILCYLCNTKIENNNKL